MILDRGVEVEHRPAAPRTPRRVSVIAKSWIIVLRGISTTSLCDQRAVGVGDVVREVRRREAVAEEVQRPVAGIDLRVRGERGRRACPPKSYDADASTGRRVAARTGSPTSPLVSSRPPCQMHRHVRLVRRAAGRPLAEARRRPSYSVCPHVPVAVPRRPCRPSRRTPCTMPSPKNQCGESPDRRVRAVADVQPGQLGRDRTQNVQPSARPHSERARSRLAATRAGRGRPARRRRGSGGRRSRQRSRSVLVEVVGLVTGAVVAGAFDVVAGDAVVDPEGSLLDASLAHLPATRQSVSLRRRVSTTASGRAD